MGCYNPVKVLFIHNIQTKAIVIAIEENAAFCTVGEKAAKVSY